MNSSRDAPGPAGPGEPGGLGGPGGLGDPGADAELDRLLRPEVQPLAPPPGAFDAVRRRAGSRRRRRAAVTSGIAAACVAAAVTATLLTLGSPGASTVTVSSNAPYATATAPGPESGGAPVPEGSATAPHAPDTATAAAPTTVPAGPDGSPAPPAASVPICATADLTATLGESDVGAGQLHVPLTLTNRASYPCSVTGYPGVSAVDGQGSQLGKAADRVSGDRERIVLRPGGSATSLLSTGTGTGTGSCEPPAAAIRVYPPDNRGSIDVRSDLTLCDGEFQVAPLAAGK